MKTIPTLIWRRKSPGSNNNFDLVVTNPQAVDARVLSASLNSIVEARRRGVTLNSDATQAFRDWLSNPSDPLKSLAYVLLSNWFLTNSGDRHSEVATRCEKLWDELFLCRPLHRLSSSVRAQNHKMLPEQFERFWPRLLEAQNGNFPTSTSSQVVIPGSSPEASSTNCAGRLRAAITVNGMRCEVDGPPLEMAQLMKFLSAWPKTTEVIGHTSESSDNRVGDAK